MKYLDLAPIARYGTARCFYLEGKQCGGTRAHDEAIACRMSDVLGVGANGDVLAAHAVRYAAHLPCEMHMVEAGWSSNADSSTTMLLVFTLLVVIRRCLALLLHCTRIDICHALACILKLYEFAALYTAETSWALDVPAYFRLR